MQHFFAVILIISCSYTVYYSTVHVHTNRAGAFTELVQSYLSAIESLVLLEGKSDIIPHPWHASPTVSKSRMLVNLRQCATLEWSGK